MIKWLGLTAISVLYICMANGCAKASEDVLRAAQGTIPCDTAGMSFSAHVLPVISINCYECHGNGHTEGGIDLHGYANIKVQVDNGNLLGAITHANGYTPMPYDGGKLSDCEIAIIISWIRSGAPDN